MTPRSFFRRTQFFWTTVLVGSLGACTNIKDDRTRTQTEGAVAGAAVGAAAAAGTAAALKKGAGTTAAAGAAGAVAGGLAGAAVGTAVANKKAGYASQESALDSQLSGLRQQIAAVREYNDGLKSIIASKEQQLATVLASDRSQGPTVQEFDLRTTINTKVTEIDSRARSWQETIDAHKAVLKKAAEDPHSADLQKEIDELTEQRAEMLRQRDKLAAIPDKLKQ
ncbi:MAG TPA: hypothetical protein VGM54_10855 [Chthoniobacter sp.]|jgi:outer membrane lipoprotein SlyB